MCLQWSGVSTQNCKDVRMSVHSGGSNSNHLKWPKSIKKVNKQKTLKFLEDSSRKTFKKFTGEKSIGTR